MANAFSKQEQVAFETVLEGSDDSTDERNGSVTAAH